MDHSEFECSEQFNFGDEDLKEFLEEEEEELRGLDEDGDWDEDADLEDLDD